MTDEAQTRQIQSSRESEQHVNMSFDLIYFFNLILRAQITTIIDALYTSFTFNCARQFKKKYKVNMVSSIEGKNRNALGKQVYQGNLFIYKMTYLVI